jgi:hypothetical protein
MNDKGEVVEILSHSVFWEKFHHSKGVNPAWCCDPRAGYKPGDPLINGWAARSDFPSFEAAEKVAASASSLSGGLHVAIDSGEHSSPRYDVIRAPAIGDEVSYGFNGDAYPIGKIVKVGKDLKRVYVENEHGIKKIFSRRKMGGAWLNGGWHLIHGVVHKLNPHF